MSLIFLVDRFAGTPTPELSSSESSPCVGVIGCTSESESSFFSLQWSPFVISSATSKEADPADAGRTDTVHRAAQRQSCARRPCTVPTLHLSDVGPKR